MEIRFVQTDGQDPDFAALCQKLDENLDLLVGRAFQRSVYAPFNTRDAIHDVPMGYDGDTPVACGGFKRLDETRAELKRIYVSPACRGRGVATRLVHRLEAAARAKGCRFCVLETGAPLKDACRLYQTLGYRVIPNYGPYVGMENSICMEKEL